MRWPAWVAGRLDQRSADAREREAIARFGPTNALRAVVDDAGRRAQALARLEDALVRSERDERIRRRRGRAAEAAGGARGTRTPDPLHAMHKLFFFGERIGVDELI